MPQCSVEREKEGCGWKRQYYKVVRLGGFEVTDLDATLSSDRITSPSVPASSSGPFSSPFCIQSSA